MTAMSLPAPLAVPSTWPGAAGPRSLVIGLDLSLTSTGIASHDWADALRPRTRGHLRLSWLRSEIADRVRHADLVVIEGPAYGAGRQAGYHESAGLWWLVAHDLWRRDLLYAVCPPKVRAIYATGNGNASKGPVRNAVAELFGLECDGPGRYDKADAATMAALGLHWLGYPLADLPDSHTRALAGVQWPDTTPAVAR